MVLELEPDAHGVHAEDPVLFAYVPAAHACEVDTREIDSTMRLGVARPHVAQPMSIVGQ